MKKLTSIISAIFVLLVASCTNELETNMQDGKFSFSSINASMADLPTSRAHLEGGGKVVWDVGDKVGIFSDTQTTPMMFECNNVDETKATFSSYGEVIGSNFMAYYPYENMAFDVNKNILTYTLWDYLEYDETQYLKQPPMIAKSNTSEFGFKHTCGVIRFSITGTKRIQSLILEGNNGEIISGSGSIDLKAETPVFAISPDELSAGKTITMAMNNLQLSSTKATDFYFMIPPSEFTHGLSLTIYCLNDDSSVTPIKKFTTKSITVPRSVIKSFSVIDTDALLREYEQEEEVTYTALMSIYNATDGDNWTNKTNWGSDKPFSEWYGVSTDIAGSVTGLALDRNNLTATSFPEGVRSLKHLVGIGLSANKLNCSLPEWIGELTNLNYIDISDSGLTGTLPESIGNLTNLKYLLLSWNKLTGEIPSTLGNLVYLEQIVINANRLSGKIPESVMQLNCWPSYWYWICDQNPIGGGISKEGLVIPAPKFKEMSIEGTEINYSIYSKNEYTILYHYFDWCVYSTEFTPKLVRMYEGYKDKGLEVIAFSEEGTIDNYKAYAEKFKTKWPYILLSDRECFYSYIGISPHVAVVDKQGNLVFDSFLDNIDDLDDFLLEKLGVPNDIEEDINPDIYQSTDFSMDGVVKQLQTATKGNGIDVVLMGDAYSDRLIADGTYHTDMETVYNNLFTEEPYKSFKDHFNVYYVNVVSLTEEYGIGETALEGFFGVGTEVGGKDATCFTYAQKAISDERMNEALLIVVMNSSAYAGTCYMYSPTESGDYGSGITVSYFPKGSDTDTFAQLLHHEACGHGFAKLADEYAYEEYGAVPTDYVTEIKTQQTNSGWWKNVDFTSAPSATRWSHFINDTRYANEGLGAYEGGLTYWTGVWRPTENSIMRYNTGGFNAPSREAIYYRIHKLAYGKDWQYDYEKFVEYDAINRNTTSARSVDKPVYYEPLHAPIVKRHSWKDAK